MRDGTCQNCDSNPVAKGARGRLLKFCSQECRNQYRFKKGRLARASAVGLVEKCCRKCGETLPRESFHRDGKRSDGLYPWCKSCRRTYMGSQPKRPPKFRTKAEYDVDYLGKMTAATKGCEGATFVSMGYLSDDARGLRRVALGARWMLCDLSYRSPRSV
jgi:hypothetical protein